MPLNLRELAQELDDYRTQVENDPDRHEALVDLEKYIGDLYVASRSVTLMTEEEHAAYVEEQYSEDIPPHIAIHVDWKAVAADDLADWTTIEFDGECYYTRDA